MIRFETTQLEIPAQDLGHIGLTDSEIVKLLSCHRPTGYWRSDLATGHVFWSERIFEIYGMKYVKGPVSLPEANGLVHPDDLPLMLELIEQAASEKTGFHYVLRLRNGGGGYKYVRSIGRYRITDDGQEELYGLFEELIDQVRLLGIVDGVDDAEA